MNRQSIYLRVLSDRVRIDCSDEPLTNVVRDLWAPFVIDGSDGCDHEYVLSRSGKRYQLGLGSEGTSGSEDPWLLLDTLRTHLSFHGLRSEPDLVGLHASVLARGGDALLLVGQPYSGKTTLLLELLKEDWNYVSDDLAPIRAPLDVLAFPKPLSVRGGERWRELGTRWPAGRELPAPQEVGLLPGSLFLGTPTSQVTPRWILFPTYRAGATLETSRMPPAAATALCIQNCHNLDEAGALAPRVFGRLCSTITAWEATYGSTEEALEAVRNCLQGQE